MADIFYTPVEGKFRCVSYHGSNERDAARRVSCRFLSASSAERYLDALQSTGAARCIGGHVETWVPGIGWCLPEAVEISE